MTASVKRLFKVAFTHPLFPGQTGEMTLTTLAKGGDVTVSNPEHPEAEVTYQSSIEFSIRHFLSAQRASVVLITEVLPAVTVDLARVRATYSGKPGCCCGCRGQYRFASAFRNEAEEDRGYEITDAEVSDRSVALTVKKMNDLIAGGEASYEVTAEYVSVDLPNRIYIAYFTNA